MKNKIKLTLLAAVAVLTVGVFTGINTQAQTADIPGWTDNGYGWWNDLGGGDYLKDGRYPVGYDYYYFSKEGYIVTGWVYSENSWKYFDPMTGHQLNSRWIGDYYVDMEGNMLTQRRVKWDSDYAGEYYVDQSGKYIPDEWYSYPDGWSLWLGSGEWAKDRLCMMNGKLYAFDSQGYMMTDSWFYMEPIAYFGDQWFYAGSNGEIVTNQWIGNYYLRKDGSMARNEYIGNYYVDKTGYATKVDNGGWKYENGRWKFYDSGYAMVGKDIVIDQRKYFFSDDGNLVTGMVKGYTDGKIRFDQYYKDSGAKAIDEWIRAEGHWMYANGRAGDIASECVIRDSRWIEPYYYFDDNGYWVEGPHIPGLEKPMYPLIDYDL